MTTKSKRNRRKAPLPHPTGSNFDFSEAPKFADKDSYVSTSTLFSVNAIELQKGRGYEGGDRWAISISADGRPDEIITLGSNAKRDAVMRSAQSFLKQHTVIPSVMLRKSGKAYYLVNMHSKLQPNN